MEEYVHNLPLMDINAGHTVSDMVDIINRNFDIIDMHGGGPAGLQGLQGVNGFPGERGEQGEAGPRGSGWLLPGEQGEEGDLSLHSDGHVFRVENGQWVDTDVCITSVGESPFVYESGVIHPKQDYVSAKTVLGGVSSNSEAALNIVGDRDAIAISGGNAAAQPAVIKIDSADNNLKISAREVGIYGNGASLTVRSGADAIHMSPLAGITPPSGVYPVVVHNQDGDIIKRTDWTWGLKDGAIVPNSLQTGKTVGNSDSRVDGVYFGLNSEINFLDTDGKYLKFNAKGAGSGGTTDTIARLSRHGLSVGGNGDNADRNFNADNHGIVIGGGSGKNGHITFLGSSSTTNYVAAESSSNPDNDGNVSTPSYSLSTNGGSGNGFKDNSPVITVKAVNSNRAASTLHIKGATMQNMAGGNVFIEGGESVGAWNSNTTTGGNVFIAGGSNRNTSGVSGDMVSGSLYNFGDVVIGLNPNNHPQILSANNNKASVRGVSKDDISGVSFYDICNFTAHGNRITLDSDANNRVVKGYSAEGLCPDLDTPDYTTLRFNGLNTLHTSEPVMVTPAYANRHQMMSGVYEVAIVYYMSGGNVQHLRKRNIAELMSSGLISGPVWNTIESGVISTIYTVWNKVGNVVSCNTRVDLYKFIRSKLFSSYYIVAPTLWQVSNDEYIGMSPDTNVYHNFLTRGVLTNIEIPLYMAANVSSPMRSNYVSGNGFVYTERPDDSASMSGTSESRTLTDDYFIPSAPVFVNNNTNYANPGVVTAYQSDNPHDQAGTNRHSADCSIYGSLSDNMPKTYLNSDGILANSPRALLTPLSSHRVYVVPECPDEIVHADPISISGIPIPYIGHFRKLVPLSKMYTSLSMNYSYLLNPGFSADGYTEFKYDAGGLPDINSPSTTSPNGGWNDGSVSK